METRQQITDSTQALAFLLGGHATVTLRSQATGVRFTYRVSVSEPRPGQAPVHFVGLLSGPDNESDYRYLGCIFTRQTFRLTAKSTAGADAPSVRAFTYVFTRLAAGQPVPGVEIWHEGRCGRCGRTLTVPESIATGFGPDCAALLGKEWAA